MAKKKYAPEVKAAVMSALLTGQSVNSVAREYKIPPGTVSGWKNRGVAGKAIQKRSEEIGDLLMEYLKANLKTIKSQAEFAENRGWLAKQTASDFAVLHGVMTDKSTRLLEAMASVSGDNDTES